MEDMEDFEQIKEAILKYHGGMQDAADNEIRALWNALSPEDAKRYLNQGD